MPHSRNLIGERWSAFTGPQGWRAVRWPATFAAVALALLVFDHLEDRISRAAFWLCAALVAMVFVWLVEKTRRQSRDLAAEHRRAVSDPLTAMPKRAALMADLRQSLSNPQDRRLLVIFELEGLQTYYDEFGDVAADTFVHQLATRLQTVLAPLSGRAYRIDPNRFGILIAADGYTSGEMIVAAASPAGLDENADRLISRPHGEALLPDEAIDPESALQLVGQRVTAFKQRQQRSARRQAHAVLMEVLASRRPEFREHLRTVAFRSISVSRRLGLSRDEMDDVFLAAELQDIGLLTVPETILEKESALDASETALIRSHPVAGAKIVSAAPGLGSVATIIRAISERYDGSGYPDGAAGEEIPIGGRVIAVCVAFAAMTSARPYQPARSKAEALAELQSCAGTQFDPRVVTTLAEDLSEQAPELVSPPAGPPSARAQEPSVLG